LLRAKQLFHCFFIADIHFEKLVSGRVVNGTQVFEVRGVRQFIDVDNLV
jgi:hypothetical protein